MREITLKIQKEEDILLLECAINWMREHNLKGMRDLLDIREKLNNNELFASTIKEKIDSYDRLMSLLAQLDMIVEERGIK
jgi:hypothetical protein